MLSAAAQRTTYNGFVPAHHAIFCTRHCGQTRLEKNDQATVKLPSRYQCVSSGTTGRVAASRGSHRNPLRCFCRHMLLACVLQLCGEDAGAHGSKGVSLQVWSRPDSARCL